MGTRFVIIFNVQSNEFSDVNTSTEAIKCNIVWYLTVFLLGHQLYKVEKNLVEYFGLTVL